MGKGSPKGVDEPGDQLGMTCRWTHSGHQIVSRPRDCKRRAPATCHWDTSWEGGSQASTREPGDQPLQESTRLGVEAHRR